MSQSCFPLEINTYLVHNKNWDLLLNTQYVYEKSRHGLHAQIENEIWMKFLT